MKREIFSETLQCFWLAWHVTGSNRLRLELPEYSCCDMYGAIKTAQHLMPGVRVIDVDSGGVPDVTYRKAGKEWEAYLYKHKKVA